VGARRRRRRLWRGSCVQPALAQLRLSTRRSCLTRRGRSSPLPSALARLLRAASLSTASPPDTLAPLDSTWVLNAAATGFGVAIGSPRRPWRDCPLTAVAVGFGAASACGRHRLGVAPHARWSCSLDCVLIAVAAGFDLSSACNRHRLGSALPARRSCFARLRAHCRCHWLQHAFCVQPASTRCRAICILVLLRSPACSPLSPFASARPLRAASIGLVLGHMHAGLPYALACAPPLPLASAWRLRATGVG